MALAYLRVIVFLTAIKQKGKLLLLAAEAKFPLQSRNCIPHGHGFMI